MVYKIILVFVYFNCVFGENFGAIDGPVVNTTSGSVKGLTLNVLNQRVDQFLSIPYAVPPLGRLRFAKPKPITKPIEGIIDATKPKNSCMQSKDPLINPEVGSISEDCLLLNIWTQKGCENNTSKLKPVMFWIHGGGLCLGTSFDERYNGSVLATNDIVFVSVNYRLNALGFLYGGEDSAPGNMGFYDQLLALQWVRENIHLFGGDKNQITIFGESAGSWSVSAHLISPLSKGLFKRAIMESGSIMYNKDRPNLIKEDALSTAKQLAKRVNCTDDKQWLECLRKVDAKELAVRASTTYPTFGTEFLPYSVQKSMNDLKFNKDLDIMAGVTKDEGSLLAYLSWPQIFQKEFMTKEDFIKFVKLSDDIFHNLNVENITEFYLNNVNTNDSNAIKWKGYEFLSEVMMKCPTYLFAKRYAEHSSPETNVFFYELTHIMNKVNELDLGVYHGADLPFVFGLSLLKPNSSSEEKVKFSEEVVKLWTNFAKYGKPDSNWPKLIDTKTHSSVTQIKDLNPKNSNKYFNDLFDKTCDGFWNFYY